MKFVFRLVKMVRWIDIFVVEWMKLVFFETTFCGGYEATEKCENDKVLGHVYLQPMSPPFFWGISKDLNYWELLSSFHQYVKSYNCF